MQPNRIGTGPGGRKGMRSFKRTEKPHPVPIVRYRGTPNTGTPGPEIRPGIDGWLDRLEHKYQESLSRLRTSKRPQIVGGGRPKRRKTGPGFLRDGAVRLALCCCAAAIVVSAVAIPTAFARQTTDITVNDGGRTLALSTSAQTVAQCLSDNAIELGPQDVLAQDPNAPIAEGMEIKIWRASEITVNSAGESSTVSMVSGTVGDALAAVGVVPDPMDEVYPSLDTPIRAGMRVEHIIVTRDTTTQTYDIPYDKVEREDPELPKGETKLVQSGKVGEFEIVTETVYKNGVVFSQTVTSEKTLREPVSEITAVGTYVPPPPPPPPPTISEIHSQKSESGSSGSGSSSSGGSKGGSSGSSSSSGGSGASSSSGGSGGGSSSSGGSSDDDGQSSKPASSPVTSPDGISAKYTLSMQATAYCKACDSGHGVTASGTYASWGTVAANTGVLPFGTKIYVEGYGYGVVEDTGGFSSNVIDLYLGDRDTCTCGSDWGRKNVTVYVIG